MQRYLAVVMKIAVKVPIQKASVYQSVTRQNAVILTPILFAVHAPLLCLLAWPRVVVVLVVNSTL